MAENSELKDIKKEIVKERAGISPSSLPTGSSAAADSMGGLPGHGKGEQESSNTTISAAAPKLGEIAKKINASSEPTPDPVQVPAATPAASSAPNPEQIKKQITEIVNKKVSSKLSELKDSLKGLEKITSLEAKISQLAEKLNSQMFQPAPQTRPVASGGGSISRELASFGEEMDFQTELYETKRAMAGIAKSLDTLSKKMEYRISILEDKSKALERIPDIEERLQDLMQKLGPENVQKLRKLIFSSDEIVDEVIPDLVSKKIRAKLDPAMNEIREMHETINDFNSRLSHIKEEVFNLEKLRDEIQELKADKENLYKQLDEEAARENERLDVLRQTVRRKIDSVADQFKQELRDIRKNQSETIKNEVNTAFLNLIDPRFADAEKKQMILEERLKRLSQVESRLEKRIDSIEAPDNVKRWLEARIGKLEQGLVSEVSGLEKKTLSNSAGIARLSNDLKMFKASMASVPKQISNHGNMINKLLDTKDFFVRSSETLTSDLRSLSDSLSSLKASHSALEQRLENHESRFTDSLNKQRDYLMGAREELSRHLSREIDSIRKALEKKSREQSRTTLAEFKAEIRRLSSTEEEIKSMRKLYDTAITRLERQISELQGSLKGAYPEIKLLDERVSGLESGLKELSGRLAEASEYHKTSDSMIKGHLMKYIDGSIKSLKRELDERRTADAEAQLREFKQELKRMESLEQELSSFRSVQEKRTDELSRELSMLSGPLTDLKELSRRVKGLESFVSGMDKQRDNDREKMMSGLGSINNRLNIVSKTMDDLAASLKELESRVSSDNERLQKALASVISDKAALEKEFENQKTRMRELIKELRNL